MKPTEKQIVIMQLVRSHLSTASRSNDLSSPTVISDFDEDLFSIYELTSSDFLGVSKVFNNLINIILDIK